MRIKPMYKVKLTENEVMGIGERRYLRTTLRRKILTLAIGVALLFVGAIFSAQYLIAKVGFFVVALVWLAILLYQFRKEGKAGKQLLEDISQLFAATS